MTVSRWGIKSLLIPNHYGYIPMPCHRIFKYCGILTCYIHGCDFVFFKIKIAICQSLLLAWYAAIHLIFSKYCTSWQEQDAAETVGGTGCPTSRQPHSDDWAWVRSSLQSCQLHLWHNYVKVAQKLQVSWCHSGRQTSSCSGIDHAAQAGHGNTLAGIFVVSDRSCPCPRRGPGVRAKASHWKWLWQFPFGISEVSLSVLSLCPQPFWVSTVLSWKLVIA